MQSLVPPDPTDSFPEAARDDIDGLIWLGYLEDRFSFCGHDFVIRTLRGEEELLAGLVIKEYVETLGQAKAHVWATISLALMAVDGAEDFCPAATPNRADYARSRFRWATQNWYWPVALYIYTKYGELLQRQQQALEALEDFWSGSPRTPTPFADSSIDKAYSPGPPLQEDIRDFLEPQDPSTPSS